MWSGLADRAPGEVALDAELIRQAQHGDREAFGVLAHTTVDGLCELAQRILSDFDRAEDAVQETLVVAWRDLPALRDPNRFEAWLRRLLVHRCYEELRRTRRSPTRPLPIDGPAVADDSVVLVDRDEIERGFRTLAPEQRAILVLHHYLGLAPAEIAETLGIPAGTARSRLHYAHQAMRAALEADGRLPVAGGQWR